AGPAPRPPAAAHARVVGTEPAAGTDLAAPPEQVVVRFSEPVRGPVTVLVRAGDGTSATTAAADLDALSLVQPVRADAAPGRWTVVYRVVGADGHPVAGAVSFTVGGAGADAGAAAPGPVRSPVAIGLAVLLLAAAGWTLLRGRRTAAPAVRLAISGALAGGGVLVAALAVGGGAPQPVAEGLPNAGALVGWARPALRLTVEAALVVAYGVLLGTGVLLRPASSGPASSGPTTAPASPARRVPASDVAFAGAVAGVAALAAAVQIWVTASDIRGIGLVEGADPDAVTAFLLEDPQGRTLAVQLLLAGATAVLATGVAQGRVGVPRRFAAGLAALAAAALLPPLTVGHLAVTPGPGLAGTVLAVHVLAAATWVGGLVALVRTAAVVGADGLRAALPGWSRLALGCALAVGATGLVNLALRLDGPAGLATGYGLVVGVKVAAFVGLVVLGAAQRLRVAEALADGATARAAAVRAVVRLAVVEVVVMAGTFAAAAALTRTPSPPRAVDPAQLDGDGSEAVLGFAPPPEAGPLRLLTGHLLDGPALVLVAVTAWWAWRSLRGRDAGRTAAGWAVAGVAVLAWSTVGGLGLYARVGLPASVGAHLLVTVVVPLLLLRAGLGAALPAALRRVPAAVAAALLVLVTAGRFVPGVQDAVMSTPGGYWAALVTGFAAGLVALARCVPSVAPGGARLLGPGPRALVLGAGVVACGALSWWLVGTATLVGLDWFSGFSVPYLRSFGDDQRRAGFVAWFAGGLPLLALLGGLVLTAGRGTPSGPAPGPEGPRDAPESIEDASSMTPADPARPNT
ncbi:copper resistance protein CopC, partial [Kineosporia sp. R_H_3]|uniref:copper resistance CopC/CopD family protein n=1 Tax=Kineosporia sp. R_H_3 TaxID=1961848 RepID=UPI00350FD344